MKQIKFGILGAAVIGLLAIFVLPYVSVGDASLKFWGFRDMPAGNAGLLNGPKQVYVALLGFLAAGAMGGLAVAGKQLLRWQSIVALVGFLLTLACEGVRKGLTGEEGMSTAIGGKLLFLAAIVGILASIGGIAKPESKA